MKITNSSGSDVAGIVETGIANKYYKKKYKNIDLTKQWVDVESGMSDLYILTLLSHLYCNK